MAALLETQALEYWVDRAGGRAGGGCGAQRRLLSSGCSFGNEGSSGLGGSGGRSGGRRVVGRADRVFNETSSGCSLAAGSVEYLMLSWKRGPWSTGNRGY